MKKPSNECCTRTVAAKKLRRGEVWVARSCVDGYLHAGWSLMSITTRARAHVSSWLFVQIPRALSPALGRRQSLSRERRCRSHPTLRSVRPARRRRRRLGHDQCAGVRPSIARCSTPLAPYVTLCNGGSRGRCRGRYPDRDVHAGPAVIVEVEVRVLLDAVRPVAVPYPEPVANSLSVDQLAHLNMFDGVTMSSGANHLYRTSCSTSDGELTCQNLPGVMSRLDTSGCEHRRATPRCRWPPTLRHTATPHRTSTSVRWPRCLCAQRLVTLFRMVGK